MAVVAIGQVNRIYTTSGRSYIRLEGLDPSVTPLDGYFRLEQTHPNHNALYSLALVAAVNRYDLQIRTVADITNQAHAEVLYMVIDW
jgi:hypothetical protein